eukprot:186290-Rhodomonas_salina.3
MPGRDKSSAATRVPHVILVPPNSRRQSQPGSTPLSSYELATPCPVLTSAMLLPGPLPRPLPGPCLRRAVPPPGPHPPTHMQY